MRLQVRTVKLDAGTGIEIEPMELHQIANVSCEPVEFMVVSMPKAHGDKEIAVFERRTSNPLLQMRRALSRGNRGCSCHVGIRKPHLTCCEAACVHEEVAIADSECPLYKVEIKEKIHKDT